MLKGQRRLAAIMFTDMDDFSALAQRNEALALELLEEHFRVLRPLISQHAGQEIKTIGDSFMVEFASPLQAIHCAVAMQEALSVRNASADKEKQINVRIGIHLGDIEHRAGDIFGDGVNIASRIEPLAETGGICISQQVYDHVHNKIEAPLVSIGKPPLKNIQTPIEVYRLILPWQQGSSAAQFSLTKPDAGGRKSIAVLPFVNMSADAENEYFSDGVTEDIITQLSKIRALKVISRTSVMQYKHTAKNLRQIGKELGVTTVLEGSVRKAGSRVRIAAQLIDAQTDEHLWAETYDRELTDIFAIQSDVAQQIAQALQAQITATEKERIEKKATENLEAYQLYLKGRFFWNKRDEEGLKKGIEYFEQALVRDPNYALAYSGLADCYSVLGWQNHLPPGEGFAKGKAAALKALEIDDGLAEAHTSLGYVSHHCDWDWHGAEREYKKAIELNPGYATAHHWYAISLVAMGQLDEGLSVMKRAQELDPLSLIIRAATGFVLYLARRYDQAIEECQKTLEMDQSFGPAHMVMGVAYTRMELHEEAVGALQKAAALMRGTWAISWLANAYAVSGQKAEAMKTFNELKEVSKRRYVSPYHLAAICTGLGEEDQALEWLEKAYEERSNWLVYLKMEPAFDTLRSDPRFTELLNRVGFGGSLRSTARRR